MSGIIKRINSELNYLSNAETKIATLMIANPADFIAMSMAEVSAKAGVSQGSINNFARKYASCGFSELKLKLAAEIGKEKNNSYTLVNEGDGIKDLFAKVEAKASEAFRTTCDLNSEDTLNGVVERILDAKRIEIYGIFHSGIVARDLHFQLIRLGFNAINTEDVLMFPVSASMLDSESLVIAISSSGRTKDILDAVRIAKENNATVVCITANRNSPLAALSDYVLLTSSGGTAVSGSMEQTRLSQMYMVDCLCTYIRYLIDSKGEKYFKLTGLISSHSVND